MKEQERVQEANEGKGKEWPKVAVIVLNWNGWRDTIECLESLQRITYPDYQIIVVDNGSTDGSVEKIKAWARGEISVESKFFEYNPTSKPLQWFEYDRKTAEAGGIVKAEFIGLPSNRKLILIETGENLGFAGGVNVGLRFALRTKQPYSWIVGNDTVVDPDALTQLIAAIYSDSKIGVAGLKIYHYEERKRLDHAGAQILPWIGEGRNIGQNTLDVGQYDETRNVDCVIGCNMLVKTAVIGRVGFLDERFFMYIEETDWQLQIRRAGHRIVYIPTALAWHKATEKTTTNLQREYYFTRNRLLFTLKNYPWLLPIVFIWSLRYSFINHLIKRRWRHLGMALKGYLDFFLGRYGGLYKDTSKVIKV
jgi:GT2 family glycosyltransferase